MSLVKLRNKIDTLDKQILQLLSKRAEVIVNVARQKAKTGVSVYAPERERQVLDSIKALNKGPLTNEGLEAIYREIMSASLALEKPLRIAFMGPEASFSNLAALKRFGSQVQYAACESITDVFLEVERDACDYGVVPVENSIEGAVSHTLDMFMDSGLKICSQIILNISHNLLAKCSKEKIKRVYSNPQVFGQCRLWLQHNLPGVELIEVSSTTRAAQLAAREKASASISSLLAAQKYNVRVIAKDIEDSPHNITRFFVIGKNIAGRTGKDKTSIMFSVKDKVGALHDILLPFKKFKINLSKIESRPSKKKAWEYYFYVDLIGHLQDQRVTKAIEQLENKCRFMKVLGSYPIGE